MDHCLDWTKAMSWDYDLVPMMGRLTEHWKVPSWGPMRATSLDSSLVPPMVTQRVIMRAPTRD